MCLGVWEGNTSTHFRMAQRIALIRVGNDIASAVPLSMERKTTQVTCAGHWTQIRSRTPVTSRALLPGCRSQEPRRLAVAKSRHSAHPPNPESGGHRELLRRLISLVCTLWKCRSLEPRLSFTSHHTRHKLTRGHLQKSRGAHTRLPVGVSGGRRCGLS